MSKRRKRIEDEDEGHINESWLLPYADILTLLLALFIVLYASSNIDNEKYQQIMESFQSELSGQEVPSGTNKKSQEQSDAPAVVEPEDDEQVSEDDVIDPELEELMKQLKKYLNDHDLTSMITLQETKRGVEISLQEMVLFDSGSAVLKDESYETLNGLLGLIENFKNPINFEGHTDNVPISTSTYSSNWELAAARAASVLHFFESKQIASERLLFSSYGEYQPMHPNDSAEHRQANRRVTIVLLRHE